MILANVTCALSVLVMRFLAIFRLILDIFSTLFHGLFQVDARTDVADMVPIDVDQ